ncbi:hypothetical protein SG34_025675 [Thalassomonas viridans]|uniref:Uncharacterized protein n=1 Tax=Thalassomonas viridans TaxID=137584 RepID=A0AAF0C8Y5_9GAMM|nr:hypothetical protein [Thalassomonas viridans]WDE04680.1 hypothetical protein SG34_025675 [Thalassomonas viridans]
MSILTDQSGDGLASYEDLETKVSHQNPASMTVTREAVITELNVWLTPSAVTYTLDESSFLPGDKVIINRFSVSSNVITVVTDEGVIFAPDGNNIGDTITMSNMPLQVTLFKNDAANWLMQVTATGGV